MKGPRFSGARIILDLIKTFLKCPFLSGARVSIVHSLDDCVKVLVVDTKSGVTHQSQI